LIVVRRQAALASVLFGLALCVGLDCDRADAKPPMKKKVSARSASPPGPSPKSVHVEASAAAALGKAYVAYRAGDFQAARKLVPHHGVANRDYATYIAAQSAALAGDPSAALPLFRELAGMAGSRFQAIAAWRAADCLWDLGKHDEARAAYEKLVPRPQTARAQTGDISDSPLDGDAAVGLARIARSLAGPRAIVAWHRLAVEYPAHPLAREAEAALEAADAPLVARDRLERAERLTSDRGWDQALAELELVTDEEPDDVRVLRDYWTATTLFKMRRQYDRAAQLYLAVAGKMAGRAAEALFHGARAYSRADRDDDAIRVYADVVHKYPSTDWAAEAQFLSGWLDFNRGRYREGLPALRATVQRYGSTKFGAEAVWYSGFSHFLLGEYAEALPELDKVAARSGRLDGGKGRYWRARTLAALGRGADADAEYRRLVGDLPFSWYAVLARARLAEKGIEIGAFGDTVRPTDAPTPVAAVAAVKDGKLAVDPLIVRADELIAAGMNVEAGLELRRGESAFFKSYGRERGLPILFDRYDRAGNANRPYELTDGSSALDRPAASARSTWEHAYPRAFREHIEKYQDLGENPPYYLYSIMRKESAYDPHVVSYADAIGLLQMIPPTTRHVVKELDMEYTDDLLYDPELNVKVGSWYIGHLALKFKGQVPIAAGSFNCGPRPVMRWLEQNGKRPIDELVELVAYTQTREYMKKVTEIYARYIYLYEGKDYLQPLAVDAAYLPNDLVY
jgi:soluble lytic murein transglycosylase